MYVDLKLWDFFFFLKKRKTNYMIRGLLDCIIYVMKWIAQWNELRNKIQCKRRMIHYHIWLEK